MKLIFVCLFLVFSLVNAKKFTAKDCREKMAELANAKIPKSTTADNEEYKRVVAYKDGHCNWNLNNAECGYDGGDCCLSKECPKDDSTGHCTCKGFDCAEPRDSKKFGNGICDLDLNHAGCFYDYGECLGALGDGMLSINKDLLQVNVVEMCFAP